MSASKKIFGFLKDTEKKVKKGLGVESKDSFVDTLSKKYNKAKNNYANSLAEKELQKRSKAYNEELKKGTGSGAANFGDYRKMAAESKRAGRQQAEKNIQTGIKVAGYGAAGLGVAGAGMAANNYRKKKKEEERIKRMGRLS